MTRRSPTLDGKDAQTVYWHRDLPPLDAELMADHTVEATSGRVAGTLSHRDKLWDRCYQELMSNVHARLVDRTNDLYSSHATRLVGSAYDHRNGFAVLL